MHPKDTLPLVYLTEDFDRLNCILLKIHCSEKTIVIGLVICKYYSSFSVMRAPQICLTEEQ